MTLQLADTLWAFQQTKINLNKKPENFFKIARLVAERSNEMIQHQKIALATEKLRQSLSVNQPT